MVHIQEQNAAVHVIIGGGGRWRSLVLMLAPLLGSLGAKDVDMI